jgi:hypothetical protein
MTAMWYMRGRRGHPGVNGSGCLRHRQNTATLGPRSPLLYQAGPRAGSEDEVNHGGARAGSQILPWTADGLYRRFFRDFPLPLVFVQGFVGKG